MAEGRFRIIGDASGVENVFHQISDVMGGFDSIARGANDSAAALGVSLDDLVPGAEEATRQFGELAGGLESVARGFSDLTSVAKALGVAAAPVAVAAAAIGTAWVVTKNQIEAAEEPTNIINARLTEQRRLLMLAREQAHKYTAAWEGFTGQAAAIQDQIDLINGALTEQELKANNVEEALRSAAEPAIQSNQKLLATVEGNIRAQKELIDELEAGSTPRQDAVNQLNAHRKEARALTSVIEGQEAALAVAIEQSRALGEFTALTAAATRDEAVAHVANAAALTAEAAARREADAAAREAGLEEEERLRQRDIKARLDKADQQAAAEQATARLQAIADAAAAEEEAHQAAAGEKLQRIKDNNAAELEAAEAHALALVNVAIEGARNVAAGEETIREAAAAEARDLVARLLAIQAAKYASEATAAFIGGNYVEGVRKAAAAAFLAAGAGAVQGGSLETQNGTGRSTNSRSGQR